MREKIVYLLAAVAAVLLTWNLHRIFLDLPDEKMQGAIYRILFFHAPAAMTWGIAAFFAMVASVLYLVRKDMRFDAFAVSATEVGLAFGAANLITGMIWARIIWGIWWAWDPRLTSMLVCVLMYSGYLMLRRAIDDPTERARNSAVLNIFAFPGVYITWKSIEWWQHIQHPGPVLSIRGASGAMDPAMENVFYWNLLALALLATALVMVRMNQETLQRELDGLRREVHAI
jgi:heme exporter protein C